MKTIDILKDALTASPDRARELIARAVEAEDVTEAECAELVALALKLGAIKARDLLRATTATIHVSNSASPPVSWWTTTSPRTTPVSGRRWCWCSPLPPSSGPSGHTGGISM